MDAWAYLAVAAIGGLVGMSELVARYRDEPARAVRSAPASVYIGINAAASLLALSAADLFGWTFGNEPGSPQARAVQVAAAGFGAMALFRTALFTVRVGSADIGIGPVALLQILLVALDRGVDRRRARDRASDVSRIMTGLRFNDIAVSLPAFSIALMQNLSPEDQEVLGRQVGGLSTSEMDDQLKVLNLGLLVMNAVGEEVLEAAVGSLRKELPGADQAESKGSLGGFLSRNKVVEPPPAAARAPLGTQGGNGQGTAPTFEPNTGEPAPIPMASPMGAPRPEPSGPTREAGEGRRRSR
jgi:hypothetical protein